MPCKDCAGGPRRRCTGVLLRPGCWRLGQRWRSAPGAPGCCAGRSICRTLRLRRRLTGPAQSVSSPQRPESRPTPLPTPCPAPAPSATPQPSATPTATPLPSAAPELADAGRIRAVQLRQGSGTGYLQLAAGSIKNSTEHPDSDLRAAVTTPSLPFSIFFQQYS